MKGKVKERLMKQKGGKKEKVASQPGATINLDDPFAHTVFIAHSPFYPWYLDIYNNIYICTMGTPKEPVGNFLTGSVP